MEDSSLEEVKISLKKRGIYLSFVNETIKVLLKENKNEKGKKEVEGGGEEVVCIDKYR